jgi:hypothetical protein
VVFLVHTCRSDAPRPLQSSYCAFDGVKYTIRFDNTEVDQIEVESGPVSFGRSLNSRIWPREIAQSPSVGRYTIRFDNTTDPARTRVKFMTDGILLREMMGDPLLSRYSVVMVPTLPSQRLPTVGIAYRRDCLP